MTIDLNQVVSALQQLLPIIAMFSQMKFFPQWTTNALNVLQAILGNQQLMDWVHSLLNNANVVQAVTAVVPAHAVGAMHGATMSASAAEIDAVATPEVKSAAAAAGVDWQTLLQYLPQIIAMLLSMFGKRN